MTLFTGGLGRAGAGGALRGLAGRVHVEWGRLRVRNREDVMEASQCQHLCLDVREDIHGFNCD